MGLTFRQERLLRRTEVALRRSDPDLAARMEVFGVFSIGLPLPAVEQVQSPLVRLRTSLARALARVGLPLARRPRSSVSRAFPG